MTDINPSQCIACAHRDGYSCTAFPDGVPAHFLVEGGDHRQPYPGDHGVRFEQKDTPEARTAFDLWQEFWGS